MGVTAPANAVSAWADQSGNGRHLTQGTGVSQATYSASDAGFGNKPVISFDGSNDFLVASTAADWNFLHNGTGMSALFVLSRDTSGGAYQTVLSTCYPGSLAQVGTFLGLRQTGAIDFSYAIQAGGSPRVIDVDIGALANNTAAAIQWNYLEGDSPSEYAIKKNNVSVYSNNSTAAPVATVAFAPLRIGLDTNGTFPMKGKIAEVLLYSKRLSVAESTKLQTYFARYGL